MNKKVKIFYAFVIIAIIISAILIGYGLKFGYSRNASVKRVKASFMSFSNTSKTSIELIDGNIITFDYNLKLKKGTLSAKLVDSRGNEIVSFKPNTSGKKDITIDQDDTYELIIQGDEAKGSYKFEWIIE